MEVGTFLGQTLSVGAVTAGVTQILKVAQSVHPLASRLPVIGPSLAWLIDTITPEDEASIHIFVAFLCFGLNILAAYLQNGYVELNYMTLTTTLMSFLNANGAYALILKRFNEKKEIVQ